MDLLPQTDAREIAEEIEIDRTFPEKRQRITARQFLYEGREEIQSTPEEYFKREFFLPLVDKALNSLNDRFARLEGVYHLYGFLFSKEDMSNAIQSGPLADKCNKLEKTLNDMI